MIRHQPRTPEEQSEETRRLRVLLVSDVHDAVRRITQLAEWLFQNSELINLTLCAGDVTTGNPAGAATPEDRAKIEGSMSSILAALEQLCSRVVYVPGNHDSPNCFNDPPPSLTPNSVNIHARWLRLQEDLVVAGLGGSIPAKQGGGSVWWGAYPYNNDEEFSDAVERLRLVDQRGPAPEKRPMPDGMFVPRGPALPFDPCGVIPVANVYDTDSVLLLSHIGPSLSWTTVDSVERPHVHSGSSYLSSLLVGAGKDCIVADMHGHAHRGRGMCELNLVPVVNPGALTEGNFALMTLEKRPGEQRWKMTSCELHSLPPLSPV